jgi:pimeloyl-ACP methyl ester carboxylesterase
MADETLHTRGTAPISRRTLLTGSLAATAAGILVPPALGQGKKEDPAKIPEPEPVSLETKDGVQIKATYYAGTAKKKSVPILMIHGWGGQQDEYRLMALSLQKQKEGYSIMTVDLRGHGLSTRQRQPDNDFKELDLDKLRPADMEKMVLDLEACKKFLVKRNNAGELNVAALCLVAAEFGAIIALRWALADWSAPRLPAFKQGQDVRGIALLSPIESFKGVTARPAINSPLIREKTISKIICVGGDDAKALAEARRLHNTFERFHGKPPPQAEAAQKQDLFFVSVETKLQGTQLLDRSFTTPRDLATFVNWRLVAKMDDFPWEERKNPLGD